MASAAASPDEDALFTQVLGPLAEAGREACRLAVERAMRSGEAGRVPIAGAAVSRAADGSLKVAALGHNHRIPEPDGEDHGYPTDHGETSAIRAMGADWGAVDWPNTVFATTLSPCVMCTRTLQAAYARGLRSIVIAESQSFKGPEGLFDAMSGMRVVRLTRPDMARQMQAFARRYPWDWAADIGEIPPRQAVVERLLLAARAERGSWCAACKPGEAAVIDADGTVLASTSDDRSSAGGNPCRAAVIAAMGRAGSSVNLRECAVAWVPLATSTGALGVDAFGDASLGACELFRPAALVVGGGGRLDEGLAGKLQAVGVEVIFAHGSALGSAGARARSRSPRG